MCVLRTSAGIEVVRRLVHQEKLKTITCGTVIAIPILNIYGFLRDSRDTPGAARDAMRAG